MNGYRDFVSKIESFRIHLKQDELGALYIENTWAVGGYRGGSCWGDKADVPIEPEKQSSFNEVDTILHKMPFPQTYLNMKKFMALVHSKETTHTGWYGNYKIIREDVIYMEELHKFYKEIENESHNDCRSTGVW